ncbi:MAG TPA: peptidylprolyl isomerase [Fimbriimonas sp.]
MLGIVAVGCRKAKPVEPVAIVNGVPITAEEYYGYLERKPNVTVVSSDGRGTVEGKVAYSLGFQALRDIVNRKLLRDIAEKEKVEPSPEDVEAEIQFRKKGDPEFVSRLTDQGLSMDDVREDIRMDLIQERLWTRGETVTDAEVDQFIKQDPRQFMLPAEADLRWIVVESDSQKQQVDRQLKAGQPFQTVAGKLSKAPGASGNGGLFPERRLEGLPAPIRSAVEATRAGKTTNWIRDGKRWIILFVEKKDPQIKIPIDDHMRTRIRRLLAIQKGRNRNDIGAKLEEALREAKVEVRKESIKKIWDEASQNLRQPPAGAPTP